jgi:hypothetical protein
VNRRWIGPIRQEELLKAQKIEVAAYMSVCKLCGTNAKLVDSHVIPKCLYGELMDENGYVSKMISDKKDIYPKRLPIGIYDNEMVCQACENIFAEWDYYACNFFNKSKGEPFLNPSTGKIMAYIYNDVDYKKLKLFFISLLWRAHTTKHPFFGRVVLGPFEEDLKRKILAGDPGEPDEYSFLLVRFNHELAEAISNPFREKYKGVNGGINGYRIYFSMHAAYIKVDKRPFEYPLSDAILRPNMPYFILARDFLTSEESALLFNMYEQNFKKV